MNGSRDTDYRDGANGVVIRPFAMIDRNDCQIYQLHDHEHQPDEPDRTIANQVLGWRLRIDPKKALISLD